VRVGVGCEGEFSFIVSIYYGTRLKWARRGIGVLISGGCSLRPILICRCICILKKDLSHSGNTRHKP
jgi:hypothetical protein